MVIPLNWIVPILGFGLFALSRASTFLPTVPLMIVVAPIFILRFIRTQPVRRGVVLTLLGMLSSVNISLWGLYDVGGPVADAAVNVTRNSLLAIVLALPYLVDRLVHPRVGGALSTLVFPSASTAILFLSSLEGPFDGTVGKAVYGIGDIRLRQTASVAGLWALVALYSWLASVVNHAWEGRFSWARSRGPVLAWVAVFLVCYAAGTARVLGSESAERGTTRVAAVVLVREDCRVISVDDLVEDRYPCPFDRTIDRISELTEQSAAGGAQIVVFQEYAITVSDSDQAELRDRLSAIAEANDVYLSVTYAAFPETGRGTNIQVLMDPGGAILIDYVKRYPLGLGDIGETGIVGKGEGVIQAVETPLGTIGAVICRDMSFPRYLRQAADLGVDIMVNPSSDTPKSTGPVYELRAVEYGFSIVRPVANGYSYAVDYNGRLLAHMDSEHTETGIMFADVPSHGVDTLYSTIGDSLCWLSLGGTPALAGVAVRRRRSEREATGSR